MENKKLIALTFDDGPTLQITEDVLDLLEEYNVKASFFLIGNQITDETAYLVKRAHDMGCSIENHSKTHPSMVKLTKAEIAAEVAYTSDKIIELTGEAPKFFRPPYIDYNQDMYDVIDLTFISGHGCFDWEPEVSSEQRAKMVLDEAKPGNIVLLHDMAGNVNTVQALRTIVPTLLERGYELVNIRELFDRSEVIPQKNCNYDGVNEIRENYN